MSRVDLGIRAVIIRIAMPTARSQRRSSDDAALFGGTRTRALALGVAALLAGFLVVFTFFLLPTLGP